MSEAGPPPPPEPAEPAESSEVGEFAEFFHTEDLPAPGSEAPRPTSHRGATPLLSRLLAPLTAVVVVVVVIVLLIVINGHNPGHGNSPAAVSVPPTGTSEAPSPSVASHPAKHGSTKPAVTATALTPSGATSPTTKPSAKPSTKPTVKPTHKAKPALTAMASVQVLNNSRRTGLAKQVAGEIHAKGWRVLATGNRQGITAVPTVYYAPGDKAAAQHLAHEFGSIRRISPNKAGALEFKGLTLVLTAAWAG